MVERHQLGGMETALNVVEARTRLEELVVGAANTAHNTGKALRRLLIAQGEVGRQYAQADRMVSHWSA